MSISICYFLDSDLCDTSAEEFLKNFEKRIGAKFTFEKFSPYSNKNTVCHTATAITNLGTWSMHFYEYQFKDAFEKEGYFNISYESKLLRLSMYYTKKTIELEEIFTDTGELFLPGNTMTNLSWWFENKQEDCLRILYEYICVINTYVRPVFNCTKLFLVGDNMHDNYDEMFSELSEGKMTINQVIELNKTFNKPEPLYTWENIRTYNSDYGWGIFLFNLDIEKKVVIESLIDLATEERKNSYTPYSHYSVGAALLSNNGDIYTGCNIENPDSDLSMCAERITFFKAINNNVRDFKYIVIVGGKEKSKPTEFVKVCNSCLQFMREFCDLEEFLVIFAVNKDKHEEYTLKTLLDEK